MQKKKTSPVFWLAVIAAVVAIFVLASPQEPPKSPAASRKATSKKATATLYTDADYKAKFEPVNNPAKNAFMPLVFKSSGGDTTAPNSLPAQFTGGDGGWAYTGTAEVNGRIQAVVENQGTGQGDFLSIGQKWKQSKVVGVTESSLTLEGGFKPLAVNNGLQGQIGPVTLRPENNPTSPVASEGDSNAN